MLLVFVFAQHVVDGKPIGGMGGNWTAGLFLSLAFDLYLYRFQADIGKSYPTDAVAVCADPVAVVCAAVFHHGGKSLYFCRAFFFVVYDE